MTIKVEFKPLDIDTVVSGTATAPGVQEAIAEMAGKVAGAAGRNMSTIQPTDPSTRMLQQDALAGIHTKPVRKFVRKEGTVIPVALVVADDWSSRWWEYGSGKRIAATRFMRKALESAPVGGKWKRWVNNGGAG
jgi:hypothetical protein